MTSAGLITRLLGPEAQRDLARQLSRALEDNANNLDALSELMEGLDMTDEPEIYNNLLQYILQSVDQKAQERYEAIVGLLRKVDHLHVEVVSQCRSKLRRYVEDHSEEFGKEEPREENGQSSFDILSMFEFLDHVFQGIDNDNLDTDILMFLGNSNQEVSFSSSQLLRWRMTSIVGKTKDTRTVWDLIFQLIQGEKAQQTLALVTWLRYVSHKEVTASTVFQEMVQKPQYWAVLQNSLVSESHDHKKYCLSILQLSVKGIEVNIDNEFMRWNMAQRTRYLKEWARFVTLFEIVAIDTSLHQAQAARADLVGTVARNSLLPPSWGYCLMSTGFQASTESVRKFSLQVLMEVPKEDRCTIGSSLHLLERVFLPYAMVASHYVVRGGCPFGTEMESYVASLLENDDKEYCRSVALSILQVLENTLESFDPARIYVSAGLVKGLGSQLLQFGRHDKPLLSLFGMESEGVVFQTSLQTLNLYLLLAFERNIEAFMRLLRSFILVNGMDVVHKEQERIRAYLREPVQGDELSEAIFGVCTQPTVSLLKLGFPLDEDIQKKFQGTWECLAQDSKATLEQLSCVNLNIYPHCIPGSFDFAPLWDRLLQDLASEDLYTLVDATNIHRILNNVYEQRDFMQFTKVTALKEAVDSAGSSLKTVPAFYKVRNEMLAQFYRTLEIYSKRNTTGNEVLDMMSPNSVHMESNMYMVGAIWNMLQGSQTEDTLQSICTLVSDLWHSLDSVRLQSNQKKLHLRIIDILTCPKVLEVAHGELGSLIASFCESVIRNTPGRRSLLPRLSSRLLEYQAYPEFERLEWLPKVLVEAWVCRQLKTNAFRLEKIMGDHYDDMRSESSSLYFSVHGLDEMTARANIVAIFGSIKSPSFAQAIFQYIVDSAQDYELFDVVRPTDGFLEWRRIQIYSILVCIMDKVDVSAHIDLFTRLVASEPSPLARVYIEWLVAAKGSEKTLLQQLENTSTMRPAVVVSYQRILYLMVKRSMDETLLEHFLTALIPAATSNKATIRHFALSLTVAVHDNIAPHTKSLSPALRATLENMYATARSSEAFGQYRSGDAHLWDIENDLDLVSVAGGVLMCVSDRDDIDYISGSAFDHLPTDALARLNFPVGKDRPHLWICNRKATVSKQGAKSTASTPLQTKSGAWTSIMDVDHDARAKEVVRSDLIVVSSLVEKPPNLGGICRLCDVLGAGLLTLHDINVKNNQQFKTVAVTADQWMPMKEVRVDEIKDFLLQKKSEGYTLVGLEQTDNSVELTTELKLPKKSLILIGREKEGVPGDLLAELDMCVEIKQVGVIRSMNIQTATAILVHAYSMQHC